MRFAVAVLSVLVVALGWSVLNAAPANYVTCQDAGSGYVTCSGVKAVASWRCDEEGLTLYADLMASEAAPDEPKRLTWDDLPASCRS